MTSETTLKSLMWSVQALACDTQDQIQLFPEFVNVPDELALDFDDCLQVIIADDSIDMNPQGLEILHQIDQNLQDLPNSSFTIESLNTNENWQTIRLLAQTCLSQFGWCMTQPPNNRASYIQ